MAKGMFAAPSKVTNHREEAEAKAALARLHKSLNEFKRLRVLNELALSGADKSCPFSPEEMQVRLVAYRDPVMELRLRQDLYNLQTKMYGREPTQEEMQAGLPPLGVLPLLAGAGIVASLAWIASSVTDHLADRERLARGVIEERASFARTFGTVVKGTLLVATVGAAGYGGYKLMKWLGKKPTPAKEVGAKEEEPAELLEAAEEMTEEEEE